MQGLGRFTFVCGALTHAKPVLGHLFAWVSAVAKGSCVTIPVAVGIFLQWLVDKIKVRPHRICRQLRAQLGEAFRVDAKAQGDFICVAGW